MSISVVSSFGNSVILDGPVFIIEEAIPFDGRRNRTKLRHSSHSVPTRFVPDSGPAAHSSPIKRIVKKFQNSLDLI